MLTTTVSHSRAGRGDELDVAAVQGAHRRDEPDPAAASLGLERRAKTRDRPRSPHDATASRVASLSAR